jgi:predicted  nucleic acid-binding Zn-ribbon protein
MAKAKKIKKEQLEKIVSQQKELNTLLTNIGVLETQKHSLLHQVAEVNKDVEEFKTVLESEYGAININLEDGSYEEIETQKDNE